MENKQTAVEWLFEKMNYITWLRNRDEISPGLADEWRKHYLDIAKEMEKKQIINVHIDGQRIYDRHSHLEWNKQISEKYYNETFSNRSD